MTQNPRKARFQGRTGSVPDRILARAENNRHLRAQQPKPALWIEARSRSGGKAGRAGSPRGFDAVYAMNERFNLAELDKLCGRTELISIRPGEFLFREDEEGRALYIVRKGNLRIMSGSTVYETVSHQAESSARWR